MNNNVQIRIWANYKDFAEVTENVPLRILPNDYGAILSPDSFREISCDNYYSFLYTPEAVCINFHTLIPTNKLRDSRVVFTLAVRRGYKLVQDTAEILSNIRTNFISFINDKSVFFETDNVNGIENKIVSVVSEWEDKIETISYPEQIFVNKENIAKGVAYITYKNNDEFCAYMREPARPEYKGFRIVFIVSEETKIVFSSRGFEEKIVSPIYKPIYKIFLIDYSSTTPIETITSIKDIISVHKEKPYRKPLELNGSLEENWSKWDVSRNIDGESFNLGIKFAPDTKVYKLNLNKLTDPFSKLKFNWGTPNTNSEELTVSGDEIGKTIDSNLVSSLQERYAVKRVTCLDGHTINVEWEERFFYNIGELKRYISNYYKIQPELSINGQLIATDKQWWDGKKEDYKITIDDTSGQYARFECRMDSPINQIKLEKNSGTKIRFFWRDDIEVSKDNPIYFKNNNEEKRIEYWQAEGKVLEFYQDKKEYSIRLKGYKPLNCYIDKKHNNTSTYIKFEPELRTKIRPYIILGVVFLFLVIMCLSGGYYVGLKYPYPQNDSVDILQSREVQTYVRSQLDSLQQVNDIELSKLKATVDSLKNIKMPDQLRLDEVQKAMAKLNKLDFKQKDVDDAKKLVKGDTKNLGICEACEEALRYCTGDGTKNQKSIGLLRTFMTGGKGQKLPKKPKEALQSILDTESYSNAYPTIRSTNSIQELMNAIKEAVKD